MRRCAFLRRAWAGYYYLLVCLGSCVRSYSVRVCCSCIEYLELKLWLQKRHSCSEKKNGGDNCVGWTYSVGVQRQGTLKLWEQAVCVIYLDTYYDLLF